MKRLGETTLGRRSHRVLRLLLSLSSFGLSGPLTSRTGDTLGPGYIYDFVFLPLTCPTREVGMNPPV